VLCGLVALSAWLAFDWIAPALVARLPEQSTWYASLGAQIVRYLSATLATVLGVIVALAVTPPLCGPALERIVVAEERELGVPERAPLGFFAELVCGVRAQLFAALFAVPLLCVLWMVDLFIPAAALVTVPAKFAVTSLALAWNLFDYPLTLRGVRMRERFALVVRYKAATLGFGIAFAILFFVPCCAVILLPVGVAGATRTLWEIVRHDPEAVPIRSKGNLSAPSARLPG
jgi:CysZ protein